MIITISETLFFFLYKLRHVIFYAVPLNAFTIELNAFGLPSPSFEFLFNSKNTFEALYENVCEVWI